MLFEFISIDDDTTKLKYKDKEFELKKTVGLLEKLQKVNFNAKMSMMKSLKERGETANDYIVIKKEGSKTIEDKSNLVELEQYFLGLESAKIYDDICLEFTKMTFPELLVDIGIDYNSVEAVQDFTLKLSTAITNQQKTPSQK